jgi:hypothetical protein
MCDMRSKYMLYTQNISSNHPDSPLVTYFLRRFVLHELCCFYVSNGKDDTFAHLNMCGSLYIDKSRQPETRKPFGVT